MSKEWAYCEVLKAVFPLLDGKDLASCLLVSKQWNLIASDDYLWKCICERRWPSLCKWHSASAVSHKKLFLNFSKRNPSRPLLPPRLSLDDLEFCIDIWCDQDLIFSKAVPGLTLQAGIKNPPSEVPEFLRSQLMEPVDDANFRMIMPVDPKFTIPFPVGRREVTVSILVGRKDTKKMAGILNQENGVQFEYMDATSCRALAFDYLSISPLYPFLSGIRAWVSLWFVDNGTDDSFNVFGVELDFCDTACSKDEILWLLDMLDWK